MVLANACLLPALLSAFGGARPKAAAAAGDTAAAGEAGAAELMAPERATLLVCWAGLALGLGISGAAPLLSGLPATWHAPFVATVVGTALNACS